MAITIPLNELWQLLPTDVFRQGFYPLDEHAWVEQRLPAHWQQHPLFEHYAGKMVYRQRFTLDDYQVQAALARFSQETATHAPALRYWLRLNGIFYYAQSYLNGVDLGRQEGYFAPQEHDITAWVEQANTLLIEVDCPDEHDKLGKRLLTGVFSHWDCIDPATNPGGIWLPIELLVTGSTHIKEVLIHTERMSETVAELRFQTTLDATNPHDALLRWTISPKNFIGEVQVIEQHRALAQGTQEIQGLLHVRDPQLWWTHDMGFPHCYDVTLAIIEQDTVLDEHTCTVGIRQFTMKNWIPQLNGVRFFAKGNNYAPGDVRIASMTRERYEYDFQMARQCHMNMLRVHAHVEHPLFYEIANEAGILLWQDFPMQWLYRRDVVEPACSQARQMVRLLYNHPAVAIWCMHNEPLRVADLADERFSTKLATYFSTFGWNWNRSVLDKKLKAAAEQIDQTRPVVRSSGEYPIPLVRKGTDTHFYYGWFSIYGPLRDWETVVRRFPHTIRFVTEFGAQSFPNLESCHKFMDADIQAINWQHLTERHQFLPNIMAHWFNWRDAPSLEALIAMSQEYQVTINRHYIDRLRYYKYRPTGGILPFMFRDTSPAIQSSIIDYWGQPKRAYAAMQRCFSPQYLFTLLEHDRYTAHTMIDLPIYVVNDTHHDQAVDISAQVFDPNERSLAHITRPLLLPADCMAMEIDRLRLKLAESGTYRLVLAMHDTQGTTIIEQDYAINVD